MAKDTTPIQEMLKTDVQGLFKISILYIFKMLITKKIHVGQTTRLFTNVYISALINCKECIIFIEEYAIERHIYFIQTFKAPFKYHIVHVALFL